MSWVDSESLPGDRFLRSAASTAGMGNSGTYRFNTHLTKTVPGQFRVRVNRPACQALEIPRNLKEDTLCRTASRTAQRLPAARHTK